MSTSHRILERSVCRWNLTQIGRRIVLMSLIVSCSTSISERAFAQDAPPAGKSDTEKVENPFPNRHPAAELEGGVEWLNAAGPISLKDVRGKVVLLDFWTFCCINCMHVLPDLAHLEEKYPNNLVVIGVHSAKFDNEKESGNIRNAILRYEIAHPVINDAHMVLWRKFGVHSWPTLVLIDPEGQYCGFVAGEGNREVLEKVIDRVIGFHRAKGTLDETPVRFDLERHQAKQTPLRYPGKIVVDEKSGRIYISDSNHNRIVVCQADGTLIDVIGSGKIGMKDGTYADAEFDHPQGMVLNGNLLYVADTENHAVRTVDLSQKSVTTLVGTGEQSHSRTTGGELQGMALNSPWDLTILNGVLYVAMAGPHQIWAHRIGSTTIWRYAGSGREDIIDGDLEQGAHAQPSGLSHDGTHLFVVDSEGSAIRKVSTDPQNDLENPQGTIVTIAGAHDLARGQSLFEFGHLDKSGDHARFQHPLGVAFRNGQLFIADTYNHKIRLINLKNRNVSTWAGAGKPGTGLDKLELAEPAGIAVTDTQVYVADTNNHRIVVIERDSKKARELTITGLTAPNITSESTVPEPPEALKATELNRTELQAGDGIRFDVEFTLPDGYKLNPLLPVSYRVKAVGDQSLIANDLLNQKQEAVTEKLNSQITIPTIAKTGEAVVLLSVTYGYCREGTGGVCKVATAHWKIPVALKDGGSASPIKLSVKAK